MSQLYALPDDRTLTIAPGETLLAATLRQGVPHAHACGGQAVCSTCRVQVLGWLIARPVLLLLSRPWPTACNCRRPCAWFASK